MLCWRSGWAVPWMTPADEPALAHLCRLEDDRETLALVLAEKGPLFERPITATTGEIVGSESYPNPALKESRRLDKSIAELRGALGLTPTSRVRLGQHVVAIRREESELARLTRERTTQ